MTHSYNHSFSNNSATIFIGVVAVYFLNYIFKIMVSLEGEIT